FTESRPSPVDVLAGATRHGLLPDAWTFGLLYLWADARLTPRTFYLAGRLSTEGWWYYFPAALGFKVPLPTLALAAVGLTLVVGGRWPSRRGRPGAPPVGSATEPPPLAPPAAPGGGLCLRPAARALLRPPPPPPPP